MKLEAETNSGGPPTVVIVGRPNVGKSTLFNRITSSRRAIVGNEPGITRDRIRLEAEWRGRRFELADTGGMQLGETGEFPVLINEQVQAAIEQAGQVIFVVDGRAELTASDRDLAEYLRRARKPVALAVNKCDTEALEAQAAAFYELGFADVYPVSAEHSRGVDALLDHVTAGLAVEETEETPEGIAVAIIGRPNVGKSTLLNRLTGRARAIVSPTPGTTRDAVDEQVEHEGVRYTFVDTAGIRRKGKTREMAEKLSVVMAQRHIRLADVVLMLIDAEEGVTALDAHIAGYADSAGKAVILVVNKWDLTQGVEQYRFEQGVRQGLKFLDYAPVVFVSALTGRGAGKLYSAIRKAYESAHRRIPTGELNRFVASVDFSRVTAPGGQKPKVQYVTQAAVAPPTFVFFTNRPEKLHFSYERFLINQLRRAFDFGGTPVRVKAKAKKRRSV